MIKNISYRKLQLDSSCWGDNLGRGKSSNAKSRNKRIIKKSIRSKLNKIFKIYYND